MNDGIRSLRSNSAPDSAPLALVVDDCACLGGPTISLEIALRLARLYTETRPTFLLLGSRRWAGLLRGGEEQLSIEHIPVPRGQGSRLAALRGAVELARTASEGQYCFVTDCLSILLLENSIDEVCATLEDLQKARGVRCSIALTHQDVVPEAASIALKRVASCVFQLEPAEEGLVRKCEPTANARVDGCVRVELKRRTGRVQAKREWYQLDRRGGVDTFADVIYTAHQQPVDAGPVVDLSANEPAMLAGMRLTLSPEEVAARESVLLPYERGRGSAPDRDSGLGKILYTRDSASEYDSDEDPDDDLDI